MPRPIFIQSTENSYHLTGRSHNKERFPLPQDEVWEIFCDQLHFVKHAFDLRIHAFLLMINHFHLIASAPSGNLSEAMAYFMRETSRTMNKLTGRINQNWGRRFHRCEIGTYHYYQNAYKYLYRNAAAVNIVDRVEDYRYSTLRGIVGLEKLRVPIDDDILIDDPVETIKWLNSVPDKFDVDSVRRALRRKKFQFAPVNNYDNRLETYLL